MSAVVVVGGGLAAGNARRRAAREGYDGAIVLFAAEPHLPYERPPLSKKVPLGAEDEAALVHTREWYADQEVSAHSGTGAPRSTWPRASSGRRRAHDYDRLLLATGSTRDGCARPTRPARR